MNRTQAIIKALGWQGGTIHQVAKETGCTVDELLYGNPITTTEGSDYAGGYWSARTCSLDYNKKNIFPKYIGKKDFWLGVAEGLIRN